ncbi:MAG: hypothetical protein Q4A72_02325 [Bacillota bacterium]|nr:hypothetical protein [Bacillota bacterium]
MELNSENNVSVGTFVISKAGRDKLRPFIILKVINSDFVLIADGDLRKVDKPKLKKLKHLSVSKLESKFIKDSLDRGEKVSDVQLRNAIAEFSLGQRA